MSDFKIKTPDQHLVSAKGLFSKPREFVGPCGIRVRLASALPPRTIILTSRPATLPSWGSIGIADPGPYTVAGHLPDDG